MNLTMANYLRLRFLDDGDGTGKLMAWAAADGFSGESNAYFDVQELNEFAEALNLFPLPPEDRRRSIAGGFGTRGDPTRVAQEHLAISVYLVNPQRGYAGIQVRMATPVWPDTRPESKKQAIVEILATYEPLSKFSRDLLSVLGGKLNEAVIEGESLS
jgi:hypothetical protein